MRRVYIETYGCALNFADTALMKTSLQRAGYEIVNNVDEADVVIINTCTVRLDTEEKMSKRIRALSDYTAKRAKLLVVAGCMATAQPYKVKKLAPNSVIVTTYNVHRVVEAIEKRADLLEEPEIPKTLYMPEPRLMQRGRVAEVPLADGCLGDCTFCITKLARRKVYSRPLRQVVDLIKQLVRRGVVEVRLTGQDVAVYGIDIEGKRLLPKLMEAITEIPGNFMVRIGMMSPDQLEPILDEFIELLRHPRFFKFVHLPVQSGDDRVLRIMKRKYTVDEYKSIVKEIRSKIPGVMIATDIIVGHPGEDEEAFENTVKLVEELRFERVHLAQYTPRPRTVAAGLPQVPDPVKKQRSKKLGEIIAKIGLEEHRRYVGSKARALVVSRGERGGLDTKLFNYMPVILPENEALPGQWCNVEIVDATWYDLRGRVLECEPSQA
ncbi:tRNA (N(6)-L-threonylcarbamoyladenosine(37)-C(2))-methylthiotran sferase [Pyrofollis japonicus]|uniref:tRNA (N(6)-L-threonylcarbamoyladenosine(37)-C(2))- methylthiotransferase n=1 Tax=Pyrofollis japonicus TaxID=3060460 RepID=UPI00295C36F6|nr:tRNA (N(6)-L-threonylcarbamoyladenosine(37)-C(2))-methylthiotransferase [Pyrofollis japonicus]BEP18018.1 tRNA (N(6)-L-threonylcarbamoyladenosine(37)-C(2))-methylthiotran sferase [Pyrofollis japonicus]